MQDVQKILARGDIIEDRYLVENMLGRGGFSNVYLVRDQQTDALFALKELIAQEKKEQERFTLEGELLMRLEHPSLPRIQRVFEGQHYNRAYILMDYIEGPNLEELRKQQPFERFSLSQVLQIMAPIMEAVDYVHSQQPPIVHRDVKPANIIVPGSGANAVLVDFGIAKEYHQSNESIQGNFTGLQMQGPFTGVLDESKHIFFTVTGKTGQTREAPLFFEGSVRSDANLVGNYRSVDQQGQCAGDYGVWSAAPMH
ncbi:MAG TPA: hypothetical protein DHV65_16105 [Ktedonobacter sp.]|nr:hypothetical protein [Ktedonobacter sp.]